MFYYLKEKAKTTIIKLSRKTEEDGVKKEKEREKNKEKDKDKHKDKTKVNRSDGSFLKPDSILELPHRIIV